MDRAVEAVVAGQICLDIIPTLVAPPALAPGRSVEIGPVVLSAGGAVSNTGLALHRLGVRTRLFARVGGDAFGRMVLDIVAGFSPQLANDVVVVPDEMTSYSIVLSPPGSDRAILHCPGANDAFGEDDIRFELAAQARLFHLGYPPRLRRLCADHGRALARIFARMKALGLTTSLDMAYPDPNGPSGRVEWLPLLQATLPHVDLFLPSERELCFVLNRQRFEESEELSADEIAELGEKCLALGAKIVVVKCGGRGIYARTCAQEQLAEMGQAAPTDLAGWAGRELWSPCFQPDRLAGTTGAGDTTVAGLLTALLRGKTLEEAVTVACAVGACNVEAPDALSGIRSWEDTLRRIEHGWPRAPISLSGTGWRQDPVTALWYRRSDPGTATPGGSSL